jgi:hypothetical protein
MSDSLMLAIGYTCFAAFMGHGSSDTPQER